MLTPAEYKKFEDKLRFIKAEWRIKYKASIKNAEKLNV
jgi:hypothetical protein